VEDEQVESFRAKTLRLAALMPVGSHERKALVQVLAEGPSQLRARLIRLAFNTPSLRPHIIPLVLEASTPFRQAVVRLASTNPQLRPRLVSALLRTADEEGEEAGSSSGRASGKFIQFMEEEGDQRVHNPDTGRTVKVKSLRGPKGKKVVQDMFQKWLEAQDDKKPANKSESKGEDKPEGKSESKGEDKPEGKSESKGEEAPAKTKFPNPSLKADRYKSLKTESYVALATKPKGGKRPPGKAGMDFIKAMVKDGAKFNEKTVADLVGAPVLTSGSKDYTLTVSGHQDGMRVTMAGPHIRNMTRVLGMDDDGPYIYNDTLNLDEDAPKGLGTKIFATQVSQAKAAGIKKIKCMAFRDRTRPDWVGYKVWPKLGYDGEIPFDKPADPDQADEVAPALPGELENRIKKAGFKKPYRVSHLYQVDGGIEWWEENGVNFKAEFDLSDDSMSMKVLGAYLAEKAQKAKVDPEEWMLKAAAEKDKKDKDKKDKDKHENVDLDDQDHTILDKVWKTLRKG
jgi:hypothetical protein